MLAQIGKYLAIFAGIFPNAPPPLNLRKLEQSSALAACTNKIDINCCEFLKFDIFFGDLSQEGHRKILSVLANLKTFFTHYNGRVVQLLHPQSLAFAASFQTNI
jgi:hypothetical protein